MANAHPRQLALSAEQRRLLQSWLAEFERDWDETRLAEHVRRLPPPQDPLRLAALVGMARIDLVRSWQQGHRVSVESYLTSYPELGTPGTAPAELVRAEFEQRRRLDGTGEVESLAARFPHLTGEMQQWAARQKLPQPTPETINPHNRATAEAPPPASTTPPPTLPEHFGRYRILKTLGKGGMGTVYLAHDTQLDRQVALKVPHLAAADAQGRARFQREARSAAGLHHPNLCPVYDVGEIDGTPYLTMAYVEGRPLSAFLRGDKLQPQRQAALLVRKLAAALQEAHRQGVVHRDLKPANIMVKPGGEPVVMDFGLAQRAQANDVRLTRHGALVGTPAYMPPEQVSGDTKAMGPACDVYSLGVILYELLTGRLPFDGPLAAVLAQVLFQEPEPPRQHRPDLDPALEAICLKAMAKKAADRLASMAELHDALGAYLRGGTAHEPPPPPPAQPLLEVPPQPLLTIPPSRPRKAGARKWPWLAGAGAAALLVVGIILAVSGGGGATIEIKLDDPEAVVSLNGEEVSRERLAQPISLPAGEHTVVVTRGKVSETQQFTLQRGEKQVVVFRLEKPRPRPAPAAPPRQTPVEQPAPSEKPAPQPQQPEIVKQPPPREEPRRGQPNVLTPKEVRLAYVRAQLPRIRFTLDAGGNPTKVCVLKRDRLGGGQPAGPGGLKPGDLAPMGGLPRMGGMRGPGGKFGLQQAPVLADNIELVDIAAAEKCVLATEPFGQRLVLVEASFPYKQQLEEHRTRLRLPSNGAVLAERVRDKDGKGRPSFRFNGLVIERAVANRDGSWGPWQRLLGKVRPEEEVERRAYDLEQAYQALVLQLPPAQRFEQDDPRLQPIIKASRGLMMGLPRQFLSRPSPPGSPPGTRQGYAGLEGNLPTILNTLQRLKETKTPPRKLPDVKPFDGPAAPPVGRAPSERPKFGQPGLEETLPDYCLVRFLDLLVEPGKVYKYRFKVKMANPNYAPNPEQRKDTTPPLARPEELVTAAWKETPPVAVPADEFLYAVDQAKVSRKKLRPGFKTPDENQAIFQIQRWVDSFRSGGGECGLGDWLVAARFFVGRGEHVRTPLGFTLEVPFYRLGETEVTLAALPGRRRGIRPPQIPLTFGDDSVLVDFEGEKERGRYTRTEMEGGKPRTVYVVDRVATEVLIQRPDGKLIARNTARDAADTVRENRYEDYLKRIEEARNGRKGPGPGINPFGK